MVENRWGLVRRLNASAGFGMKALRFGLINLAGRVIQHGRRLVLRVSAAGQTLATLLTARQTIRRLATIGPAG